MKRMRIPLLAAVGVAIVELIFGSFFDLSTSTAIASHDDAFALTVSAIGPTIVLTLTLIANEVVARIKALHLEEPVEE